VTATPGGFAAVGFGALVADDYYGPRQGIVWTSADGRTWQETADLAFNYVTLEAIASLNDSLYVFGTSATCALEEPKCVEAPDSGWAVWRSLPDGTWEKLPQLEQMRTGGIDGVAVAHGNLVVFGWTLDQEQTVIWVSPDGVNWSQTASLAGMESVTTVSEAPGGVSAFGTRYSDELGDIVPVPAFSPDGVTFGSVEAPDLPGATLHALAAGAAGLVAVGETSDEDLNFTGLALHSPDGLSWQSASATDDSFQGSELLTVHVVPGGYVALGLPDPEEFDVTTAQSWLSSDGLSWSKQAQFGQDFTSLTTSAAGPASVVAFTVTVQGFEETSATSEPAAWILAP